MPPEGEPSASPAEPTEPTATPTDADPTDPQATPPAEPPEHMVTKSRFDEVNVKRKEAERMLAEATARISELESTAAPPPAEPQPAQLEEAPSHLSPREQIKWYVERDAASYVERELGMPLKDAKALLSTAQNTSKDYAERRWNDMCTQHKLDPANQEVQEFVAGLVKVGVKLDDAFQRVSKLYGQPAPPGNGAQPQRASVEVTPGVNPQAAPDRVPRNPREAAEMAEKGIRAPTLSSDDIIRRAMEADRGK